MSRYIDADALIRDLQERYCRPCKASGLDYNGVKCKSCQFDDEIDDIDGFADDSIDIVRCKECIYYSDGECKCGLLPFSEYSDTANLWVTPKPDDFCSYGEREGE